MDRKAGDRGSAAGESFDSVSVHFLPLELTFKIPTNEPLPKLASAT